MLFVTLGRWKKPTKEMLAETYMLIEEGARAGVKWQGMYCTLGRYHCVIIFEAVDEKAVVKSSSSKSGTWPPQKPLSQS